MCNFQRQKYRITRRIRETIIANDHNDFSFFTNIPFIIKYRPTIVQSTVAAMAFLGTDGA